MELFMFLSSVVLVVLQTTEAFRILMPGDLPMVFDVVDDSPNGASAAAAPYGVDSGGDINFAVGNIGSPGPSSPPEETAVEDDGCGLSYGTIIFNGTCQRLLMRSVCSEGEWLVKKKESDEGECVPNPCPKGQLLFEDTCVDASDGDVCADGQMLYVDLTGLVHCDCEPSYFYNPWVGQCFTLHDRGSCDFGKYLEVIEGGRVACVDNPCLMEGYLRNKADGRCYLKQYRGICPEGYPFHFDNTTLTAHCHTPPTRTIFDLPTVRACPEGSARDFVGNCREAYRVPVTISSSFDGCKIGHKRDPRGTCRRVHKLFG